MALTQEQAAEKGFHLVEVLADGLHRFERIVEAGTQVITGKSLDEALAEIDARLAAHAGAPSGISSRSDGALESRDDQEAASVSIGEPGPSPAADAEANANAEAAKIIEDAKAQAAAIVAQAQAEADSIKAGEAEVVPSESNDGSDTGEAPAPADASAPAAAPEAPTVES